MTAVTSPCASVETTCLIPDHIVFAAFWIFVQMFDASVFSFSKFPVTRSISKITGARIVFFSSSQAPCAIATSPCQIPCNVVTAFCHSVVIVVTTPDMTGFCIIVVQMFVKKSDTCCQIPDHHAGIPVKNVITLFQACGIVTVKNVMIPFQIPMKKSDTCCQIPDHHSGTPERNSINVLHACGIVSVKNDAIFCTTAFTPSRNHSHFVYSNTNAATIAAITAITGFAAITPNRAVKAPFTFPSMLVIVVSVFIFETALQLQIFRSQLSRSL